MRVVFLLAFLLAAPEQLRSETLPLRVFTSADGLATSVIHTMIRDSDGFLWMGGRGGISRFDGRGFTSFSIDDALSTPLIHAILESRDRRYIWIAADNGLYRVTKNRDVAAVVSNQSLSQDRKLESRKISKSSFWAIFEEADGSILGGSFDGLHRVTVNEEAEPVIENVVFNKTLDLTNRRAVRNFTLAEDGTLWIASDAGFIRRLTDGRWITYELPPVVKVGMESFSILLDSNGLIWLTARTGMHIFRPKPEAQLKEMADGSHVSPVPREVRVEDIGSIDLPKADDEMIHLDFVSEPGPASSAGVAVNPIVEAIYPSSDGRIYVPTRRGFYIFENGSYISFRDDRLLPGLSKRITEDLRGDIWFGTSAGAVKYERLGLTSFGASGGFPEPNIHAIQETPDGKLIVSHGTWHLSVLENNRFEHFRLRLPEKARFSWTSFPIVMDSAGAIWALETNGLYRIPFGGNLASTINSTAKYHPEINIAITNRMFYRAFNDLKGIIYFATGGDTDTEKDLIRLDPRTGKWEGLSRLPGFPQNRTVASFAEDRSGNLWFGFYASGDVIRVSGETVRIFGPDDGLPHGSILSLHVDTAGRLWLGSNSGGLARVDDPAADVPVFKIYTQANSGLTSDNIRCLTSGTDGRIYAGTVRGVSVIEPEQETVSRITTNDGLASDFVHAAFRDRQGTVWFGTANGLSRYEPRNAPEAFIPKVWIGGIRIAGNTYSVSEFGQTAVSGIEVSHAENNVEIDFLSNGEKGRTRYQYLIESSGSGWSLPNEQTTVALANLSPGNYRFMVRTLGEGNAVSEPATVTLTIAPPFWRTWWFIGLILSAAVGSVLTLDRYRVMKTRQVQGALTLSRESEHRFRTLADTASDAIITINEDSTIIFVNEAIEKVFGYSPDEVIGKQMPMLMPERKRDGHHAGISRYLSTGRRNINWSGVPLPGLHKNGQEIPLEVSFGEFERDGKRYFTGIARDISERRRAEQALQEAREERFRELERVRIRIATDLHDDIGSSLTQIAVLSEVARGQASEIEAKTLSMPLERIKSVSKELVAVMSDIVWAINPQKDNLSDLVLRMRRFGSDVFSSRGIGFELKVPDLDREVHLGANIRREIFAIYKEAVNNAVKYSDCSHASCRIGINEVMIDLAISDNGKGFDTAEVLSDNFRPEIGGNGLVSIRRRAVELGGTCEILSAPGKGTTISVQIPLHGHDTFMPESGGNGSGPDSPGNLPE